MKRLTAAWNAVLDWLFDPRCKVCGERIPSASYEIHWRLDHAGDWRAA